MPRERALRSRSVPTTRTAMFSTKSDEPVRSESIGEYILGLLAEFSTKIVRIVHQPERFSIEIQGQRFRYTPDFLLVWSCGRYAYIEIKDARKLKDGSQVVERLEAAKAFFAARGEELLVFSDLDLRRNEVLLANIKHLKRFRSPMVEKYDLAPEHLAALLPTTLGHLRQQIGSTACLSLIAHEKVWCDLTEQMTDESLVQEMTEDGYEFIA